MPIVAAWFNVQCGPPYTNCPNELYLPSGSSLSMDLSGTLNFNFLYTGEHPALVDSVNVAVQKPVTTTGTLQAEVWNSSRGPPHTEDDFDLMFTVPTEEIAEIGTSNMTTLFLPERIKLTPGDYFNCDLTILFAGQTGAPIFWPVTRETVAEKILNVDEMLGGFPSYSTSQDTCPMFQLIGTFEGQTPPREPSEPLNGDWRLAALAGFAAGALGLFMVYKIRGVV